MARLIGLDWGIPDASHLHSYHPDEFPVLWAARNVDIASLSLNPHFYNYGSLYPFSISLFASAAAAVGLLSPDWRAFTSPADLATLHLLARFLTALFGIGTVFLTYRLAQASYASPYPLVAAGLVGFYPLHAIHSHYATVDVPAAFWITLALWQSLILYRTRRLPAYIWCGVAAGLAAATKYNAGLVLLAPLAAHFLSRPVPPPKPPHKGKSIPPKHPSPTLPLLLLLTGVAFLAGCPGAVLAPSEFWRDVSYELFEHSRMGHGLVFERTGNGWIYHLAVNLRVGMTLPLMLASLAGIGICLKKAPRTAWILLSFVLPYFLSAGMSHVRFMRYMIPLLSPLAALTADGLAFLAAQAGIPGRAQKFGLWVRQGRRAAAAGLMLLLCAGGGAFAAFETAAFTALLAGQDARDEAAGWIRENLPKGRSIGMTTEPWFYSPPLNPWNGGAKTRPLFERTKNDSGYRLTVTGTDAERLRAAKPDYFVISDFEYGDPLRLHLPGFEAFWKALNHDYREIRRFEKTPRLGPLDFGKKGLPPHDWLYPYPALRLYERVSKG
ncbi:MAG: glycosyltransferase family 39 protein [Armatimonadetes bacterium]|nr:glycosyltransferase family 39 protein [Armatimonadota bacterium]